MGLTVPGESFIPGGRPPCSNHAPGMQLDVASNWKK
jgi:hypothetical protein